MIRVTKARDSLALANLRRWCESGCGGRVESSKQAFDSKHRLVTVLSSKSRSMQTRPHLARGGRLSGESWLCRCSLGKKEGVRLSKARAPPCISAAVPPALISPLFTRAQAPLTCIENTSIKTSPSNNQQRDYRPLERNLAIKTQDNVSSLVSERMPTSDSSTESSTFTTGTNIPSASKEDQSPPTTS